jgi:hypothetical protein
MRCSSEEALGAGAVAAALTCGFAMAITVGLLREAFKPVLGLREEPRLFTGSCIFRSSS